MLEAMARAAKRVDTTTRYGQQAQIIRVVAYVWPVRVDPFGNSSIREPTPIELVETIPRLWMVAMDAPDDCEMSSFNRGSHRIPKLSR